MTSIELIEKLSNAKGVSGFEGEVVAIIKDFAQSFATVEIDSMLNVYLYPQGVDVGRSTKPVVVLDAHSDEVGLLVQSVHSNGLIQIVGMGGWNPSSLQAQRFDIRNRDGEYIPAVVSSIPVHLIKKSGGASSADPAIQIHDIRLDVGASSRQEVENDFGILPGSPIVPTATFCRNRVNNTFMGKALDNRLGCAAALLACKELFAEADKLDVLPVGTISSQEELGLRGARVSSQRVCSQKVCPSVAIVLEASPSDELTSPTDVAQGVLGKGTQVRVFDPTMVAHPGFLAFVCRAGDDAGVKYQRAVRSGGGTDAGVLHLQGKGVPTVVVAVPSRYIHSHHAIASMGDFESTVELVVAAVKRMTPSAIDGLHDGTYLTNG